MGAVKHQLALALLATALALPAGANDAPRHRAVQNLDYGESLYHYYRGDYPRALTKLMVAREDGGIDGHGRYPELMSAGLALAFGLREAAEAQFNQLLGQGEPPRVRQAARYQLARLHYLTGQNDTARANLDKLGEASALDPSQRSGAALLALNLSIRAGQIPPLAQAGPLLENVGPHRALALYNLGGASAREGKLIRAQNYYQAALAEPLPEKANARETALALQDKARTALGYTHLDQRDYASAKAAFRQVRRDTALANRALLGYGWAAASYSDYALALKPWQLLRGRSLLDTAVQETLIAVPWAYEQLKAPKTALDAYRESEQLLAEQFQRVGQLLDSLDQTKLVQALTPGADEPWLTVRDQGPQNWLTLTDGQRVSGQSPYLNRLLQRDEFQSQAQALRDLLGLRGRLEQWQDKLGVYDQLVRDKQARRQMRETSVTEQDTLAQHRQLAERHRALRERFERIRNERDALALAGPDTRRLMARVNNARAQLEAIGTRAETPPDARQKLDLLAGILRWRAAQNYPDHRWQMQKHLSQLAGELETAHERSARIEVLFASDPDIAGQLTRIDALDSRVEARLADLNAQIDAQAGTLRRQLGNTLEQHRQRLQDYLAQTRLAVARLLDTAYRADPSDGEGE